MEKHNDQPQSALTSKKRKLDANARPNVVADMQRQLDMQRMELQRKGMGTLYPQQATSNFPATTPGGYAMPQPLRTTLSTAPRGCPIPQPSPNALGTVTGTVYATQLKPHVHGDAVVEA